MAEAKLKGISFVHFHEYLVEMHGEEGLKLISGGVSPRAAKTITQPNAAEWYPLADLVELERAFVDRFHGGDSTRSALIGCYDLERSVGKVYRFLFKFLEPAFLVKRSAKLWSTLVDQGRVEIEELEANRIVMRIHELNPLHAVYCNDIRGSSLGMLQACGVRTGVVEHTECVLDGKPACRFDIHW